MNDIAISSKKCLICKGGKKNDCLHWHIDPETKDIWVWCQGVCQRGYSLQTYCHLAGVSLSEFLKLDFDFQEAKQNEVSRMDWPRTFVTMADPRAKKGVEYVRSRGLTLDGDMYYDIEDEGIVFPYYVDNVFVGAQIRFIESRMNADGEEWKITTLPGTRLGLLFYGWNQTALSPSVQAIVVTEGAFNALSLQQALNTVYGGLYRNPWRVIAASGSGASQAQRDALKEIKDSGVKVVVAPDSDEAGFKMLNKYKDSEVATHYALTMDTEKDWNSMLQEIGHEELGKFFLRQVKNINS